ncbi:glycosyltransferase [Lactiplantibacillus plantarum]|uniref:glycosyltransferase family 2 protein n=1 Tax=Lactiplantibacillus plantarum TaxID=1590 RepID=UPI001AAFB400|nr:glycosyltransferase family 2 protein [Lactiplantibacillus plantarum]MBO2723196.1 glycosyltransferase [Lactiplantibacillus plantarum]
MKVSVIVPLHNVQDYVEQLIRSLMSQTCKSFEVILVDDGSNDKTFSLAKDAVSNDKRFFLLHQENGGQSSARVLGIEHARGEFVMFADGDDWVEKNFVEDLLTVVVSQQTEIAFANYYLDYPAHQRRESRIRYNVDEFGNQVTEERLRSLWIEGKIEGFVWNKIFSRRLARLMIHDSNNYKEDTRFVSSCIAQVDQISFVSRPSYHYFQRSGSAIHSPATISQWDGCFSTLRQLRSLATSNLLDIEWKKRAAREILILLLRTKKINHDVAFEAFQKNQDLVLLLRNTGNNRLDKIIMNKISDDYIPWKLIWFRRILSSLKEMRR